MAARPARSARSTFVAHIRFASTGAVSPENTHPFEQQGRLFAHNGVIGDVGRLDAELGEARQLVKGETDSERFFALITKHIDNDVGQAITTAAGWIAENLPVFALNLILTTPSELWALRYPDTHELHVLERAPGGPGGGATSSTPARAGRCECARASSRAYRRSSSRQSRWMRTPAGGRSTRVSCCTWTLI